MSDFPSIKLGREYYHRQEEIISWCKNNIGNGGWLSGPGFRDNTIWSVNCMFGYTTFVFKNTKDATLFSLKWV